MLFGLTQLWKSQQEFIQEEQTKLIGKYYILIIYIKFIKS